MKNSEIEKFKTSEDDLCKKFSKAVLQIKNTLEQNWMTNLFNKLTETHLETLQTDALIMSKKNVKEQKNNKTLHEIFST